MRVEVLEGVERRRRWTGERKLSILMGVGLRGATVTDVARRHAVSRSQLYTWRRDLKRHGALRPVEPSDGRSVFVPVAPPPLPAPMTGPEPAGMTAPEPMPDPSACSGRAGADVAGVPDTAAAVEIALANGRWLRVPPGLEEAALARLIRIAEGARSAPARGCGSAWPAG